MTNSRRFRTLSFTLSGMKTFLALMLLAGVSLTPVQADIPAPKPTVITVTNFAAFPKYKFSYQVEGQQDVKAIPDGKPFTAHNNVNLLIKNSGEGEQQRWEQIRYDWKGASIDLKIEGVTQEGKAIKVAYKSIGKNPVPGKKTAEATRPSPVPLFALTGIGACGLMLLARQRRSDPQV